MRARRKPARRTRNPATAERSLSWQKTYLEPDEWGDPREVKPPRWVTTVTPARVTRGHWRSPSTKEAIAIAERVGVDSYRLRNGEYGRARHLGAGNFGIAYLVEADDGPRVVKVPAATNIHQRPWSREEQTRNLLHEAGVANELGRKGFGCIPRTVFVRYGGGTPALVREYGEPVTSLSGPEYAALEKELVAIERKHGWHVADELSLYRRANGTVFVGDVGFWQAPKPRARGEKRRPWRDMESSLTFLLDQAQKTYGAPRVTELPRLWGIAALLHKRDRAPDDWDAELAQELLDDVASRAAEGVSTPRDLAPVITRARVILRRYGKPARRRH